MKWAIGGRSVTERYALFRLEVHKRNAIYGFEFFFSKLLEETHLTAGHLYCKHGKRPIIRPPPPPHL